VARSWWLANRKLRSRDLAAHTPINCRESWYPGEEGGSSHSWKHSRARTIRGKAFPVYRSTLGGQLPPFEKLRDERTHVSLFEGKPLYPFGYGSESNDVLIQWLETACRTQ